MSYTYSIYDLIITTPFPCTMLTLAPSGSVPDVTVIDGEVPRTLPYPAMKDRAWQAAPGIFLYRGGRRAGRFLVEGGQRIILERNPAAEDNLLCALFLTSVMAALMRQRGMLVLHANVAVTPEGAVAIAGVSGSGKSTTQAALLTRGCQMLSDDVTVLRLDADGTIMALPGVAKMNLCEDAAQRFGHDISQLSRNPILGLKVLVPVASESCLSQAVPLKKIYLINKHAGDDLIQHSLMGAQRFLALQECLYGPQLPEESICLFPFMAAMTRQVEVVSLHRPSRGCSVNKVVEAILHG